MFPKKCTCCAIVAGWLAINAFCPVHRKGELHPETPSAQNDVQNDPRPGAIGTSSPVTGSSYGGATTITAAPWDLLLKG